MIAESAMLAAPKIPHRRPISPSPVKTLIEIVADYFCRRRFRAFRTGDETSRLLAFRLRRFKAHITSGSRLLCKVGPVALEAMVERQVASAHYQFLESVADCDAHLKLTLIGGITQIAYVGYSGASR